MAHTTPTLDTLWSVLNPLLRRYDLTRAEEVEKTLLIAATNALTALKEGASNEGIVAIIKQVLDHDVRGWPER